MEYGSLHNLLRNDTMYLSGEIILQMARDVSGFSSLSSWDPCCNFELTICVEFLSSPKESVFCMVQSHPFYTEI